MNEVFALSAPQWQRLRALLDEALALAPPARAAWLARLQGDDAALGPRLAALLRHGDAAPSVLDTLPRVETADFAPPVPAAAPARIGPYRLLRELGSGGMASVWLAERTDVLQQRPVALKLPHASLGAATRRAGLAERLRREGEILSTLTHPHIARLYDAGVADDGQPWLALEWIEGERIDRWCDARALSVAERLRLFLQAVRAVAHAHTRLVVHRDLKPGNILVTPEGEVKLLDFGIAKLLGEAEGEAGATELTQQHGRALTLDYASPEQLSGAPIGTASDVHALGVVLYELLTGVRPYRAITGANPSAAQLEDAIRHGEPKRPSEVTADRERRRVLRGDIDTLLLKALKKDPAARYATADALADDIVRHLERRPLLAQPDRFGYRARRFVARNRLAVGSATAIVAALCAGSALALWQARAALAEARRAEQISQFVVAMFEGVDPQAAGSARSVSAQAILDRAERRLVASTAADDVDMRAALRLALARSRQGLGDHARAVALADAALADPALPASHRTRAPLLLLKATALKDLQRLDEADATLAALPAPGPGADPELSAQATLLRGLVAHQRGQWQAAREQAEHVLGSLPPATATAPASLLRARAHELAAQGASMLRDKPAAQRHARAAWDERRRLHVDDPQHPDLVFTQQLLGAALVDAGAMADAQPLLQHALEATRAVLGPDSGRIVEYASRLAIVEAELGRFGRALALLEDAERVAQAGGAPESMMRAGQLRTLARAQLRQRRHAEALPRLQRSLAMLERFQSPHVARVVRADVLFAAAHVSTPLAQAEAGLARILAEQAQVEPRYRTHLPHHYRGVLLRLDGRPAEAVQALQAGEPLTRANTRKVETAEMLVDLALAWLDAGRPDAAEAPLAEADGVFAKLGGDPFPARADAALARARIALAAQRPAEAVTAARAATAFWDRHDPVGREAAVARHWLARALLAAGDGTEARRLRTASHATLRTSRFAADRNLIRAAPAAEARPRLPEGRGRHRLTAAAPDPDAAASMHTARGAAAFERRRA
jgi:serine/threonine-protein kinase